MLTSGMNKTYIKAFAIIVVFVLSIAIIGCSTHTGDTLSEEFKSPPESSNPGVYWYFMDGNLSREEMTKDLESMKEVGISNLIFLEVGIGVPRGPVDFMSEEWQDLFVHAVREAERLGIKILLGAGPGWCGSGGPWVKPEESMQHLVWEAPEGKWTIVRMGKRVTGASTRPSPEPVIGLESDKLNARARWTCTPGHCPGKCAAGSASRFSWQARQRIIHTNDCKTWSGNHTFGC
jgi:hypothetical protein